MKQTESEQTLYTGAKCPYCGSENISAQTPEGNGADTIYQNVDCDNCGKIWTEEYRLTDCLIDDCTDSIGVAGKYPAAPDLLAELESALGVIEDAFAYSDFMARHFGRGHGFSDNHGRTEQGILQGIRAAIAKATK